MPRPADPAIKGAIHPTVMPEPIADFEGNSMLCNCYPPDTNAAVGPTHVFQTVNLEFNIFDKTGTSLTGGPVATNALWDGFGGPCENTNDGDPIVKYDQLSQRWVITQFAVEQTPHLECFAVSVTSDPLGAYYQSAYDFGPVFNDYPKLSLMPDAYYLTVRQFDAADGSAVVAFDRLAMVAGDPATAISFDISSVYDSDTFLAADLQGTNLPAKGTPESIIGIGNPDYDGWPTSVLHFVQMTPNFSDPPSTVITNFDVDVDPFVPRFAYTDQPGGFPDLEVLPFPMYTPNYRNFGDHDALVFTHDVNTPDNRVGRRWYEVRSPLSATPVIHQQGTFAPDDGLSRWMGSAALDFVGNIAMGYSVASSTVFPSIWYTGRLPGDPLGEMSQGEAVLIDGTGSQDGGAARWGDYSSMVTDPTDECTFWYTTEYIETTGLATWQTRIGSFKFPSCSIGPTGTLEGTVSDGANPIQGATVTADAAGTTTDAAGHYTFTLPVGDYDMTASKYGFFPGSANDVPVTDGGTTTQDFVLSPAPSTVVNGVVRDGSGGNWPLYARIQISGPGFPGATLWTDPVTGYYEVTLVEGITYTFVITAVSPGYEPGGGTLPLGVPVNAPLLVQNWTLDANLGECTAPGYSPVAGGVVLFQDFSGGVIPAGWTVTNDSTGGNGMPTEWVAEDGGAPCDNYPGNLTGGTGFFAVADSDCPGGDVVMDTSLITPSVDLSAFETARVQFKEDYLNLGDTIDVDVSVDGGTTWTNVLRRTTSARGPLTTTIDITSVAAGEADVRVRFHYYNAFFAWWWQVDDIEIAGGGCEPGSGGLVVGTVNDDATDAGINGATVQNIGGDSTTTFATPDPNQGDGFYILYAEAGNETFEASATNYEPQQKSTIVVPSGATRLDFSLLSGNLTAAPSPLSARVDPGGTDTETLTLTNTGGAPATFEIIEINSPLLPNLTKGFVNEALRQQVLARLPHNAKGPVAAAARSTQGLAPLPNPRVADRVLAAGDVLASYDSNIAYGWGVATSGANLWLSNLGVAGGDDLDYEYTSDGALTGDTIDDSSQIDAWAGDGAFNASTGKFWRVDVVNAGSSCIFELDPATNTVTGNRICPATGTSQRGLAYDIATNTFYIGSWNDGTIYHFDTDGNIIDSAFVSLSISGLAYNSANGHLLVMQNIPGGDDITVLDALNNYDVLGSYPILDDGSPAITAFGGAGAEFDCLGNLWVIDQNTQVIYLVETGETAGCEVDIPWFSADPTEGTVAANGGTQDIIGTFEAGTMLPGLYLAQIQVKTNTPHTIDPIPVTMVIRFLDVPDDNQFEAFIYGAAGAGIMMGGPPNCPAGILNFCPDNVVTRADMAGYIWRAVMGANTPPPVYQNIFGDVTFNDYNSFYIQGIFDLGITAGCGSGNYCPNAPNTRAQMSVFIWKGEHGGDATPPPCTPPGDFADVLCPGAFAADYIYALFAEGVTAGCGGGNFCPDANITNGQMAVFLVKAFNIPYLP